MNLISYLFPIQDIGTLFLKFDPRNYVMKLGNINKQHSIYYSFSLKRFVGNRTENSKIPLTYEKDNFLKSYIYF